MTAHEILTVQQFGRAVARILRAAMVGQTGLWVSAQVWVTLPGALVRPPAAVLAGALPVDGCPTGLPLLVVRPREPATDPGPWAWASAGVPCWEVGSDEVRIWRAAAPAGPGSDRSPARVLGVADVAELPAAAGQLPAGDLIAAAAAARVRRRRPAPACNCCLTGGALLS